MTAGKTILMECSICLLYELASITAGTAVTAGETILMECSICQLFELATITAVTADGRRNHADGMQHLPVR